MSKRMRRREPSFLARTEPDRALAVPDLAPEALHELIRHRGLDACGDLVSLATPEQLTSVLDLDLWRPAQPGLDERFDPARFGEWIAMLVDIGESVAARIVAAMDEDLVATGLAHHLRVFDPGTFEPTEQTDDEPLDIKPKPEIGLECEIGGYVVFGTRDDAWDAIVTLLAALDEEHEAYFHAVMCECRRLSNDRPEVDGLDELLGTPEQQLHDLGIAREERMSQQGYVAAADARAFLQMARLPRSQRPADAAAINVIADVYLGSAGVSRVDRGSGTRDTAYLTRARELAFLANTLMAGCSVQSRAFTAEEASEAAAAICTLGREYTLARSAAAEQEQQKPARSADAQAETHTRTTSQTRTQAATSPLGDGDIDIDAEVAAASSHAMVMAGSDSRIGRAGGAATALPANISPGHELVTAFEVGWSVLHEEISLFVANTMIALLTELHSHDEGIQRDLQLLRRELIKHRDAGTPWLVRETLDAIALLDLTAWTSLLGLFSECPVLPEMLRATLEGRTGAVSATRFEFFSTAAQIREVHAFMEKLLDLLRC